MGSYAKVDALGCALARKLILFFVFFGLASSAFPQQLSSDAARLAAAQAAFDSGKWDEVASLSRGPREQLAELDFLRGLALARKQMWNESREAFRTGHLKSPSDPRFLVELAGIDYKQNDFSAATRICAPLCDWALEITTHLISWAQFIFCRAILRRRSNIGMR
jgi:hypothetical protein